MMTHSNTSGKCKDQPRRTQSAPASASQSLHTADPPLEILKSKTLTLFRVLLFCCGIQALFSAVSFAFEKASPKDVALDAARLKEARDYALTGSGSGLILRHGKLVMTWGDQAQRYDLKSTTKSIGITALGFALADNRIALDDKASKYHPTLAIPPQTNAETGWIDRITIRHLATQTSGFEKPGGYGKLLFQPGTKWLYSDAGPNWLAECLTLIYKRDLNDLMFERVFTPIGITPADLTWRKNAYRDARIEGIMRREFGSGIHANVNAMARIGQLYLNRGRWNGKQLIPESFVHMARAPVPGVAGLPTANESSSMDIASNHYGLLWWNNADGSIEGVPTDTYWSWGLYDSLIVVMPAYDMVVARAGKSWLRKEGDAHYKVLEPFLQPIAAAVTDRSSNPVMTHVPAPNNLHPKKPRQQPDPPYPASPVIKSITWAPKDTIIRLAEGSDNWPTTWADDDALYTAYGDGWGFEPKVEKKLSLGLARIDGMPTAITGTNIRSLTGEQLGQGAAGRKASGLLCVDGTLYMWTRNAQNSQLAWSQDHGRRWQWSDWRFTEGFGCPTFLNFGKNYAGARDNYVYIYSLDSSSAYMPADHMNLARVPKNRITHRKAYEFFTHLDDDGQPQWTNDITRRGPVFTHKGNCCRSSVTYNAPLQRYLWWQVLPTNPDFTTERPDTRFEGGFTIYDAPEPWGPWTTAFFTSKWDTGPGESATIPTKWISQDGTTIFLIFSGQDALSIRKATIQLR
jgi:CubicO group peptidase (beta-lactamase class C family)